MSRILGAALAAALAAAAGCGEEAPAVDAEQLRRARVMEDLMLGRGPIGGEFVLTAHDGKPLSLSGLRGKVVLLYFGYTYCPDVCPTDLVEVAELLRSLGPRAGEVQALYVTVDPERDTPSHLASYVSAFDPRIIGLTGSVDEVRAVTDRYKAYFAKVPSGSGYLLEHSANFYVLDRNGQFAGSLPPGTKADRLADVVRERLAAASSQRQRRRGASHAVLKRRSPAARLSASLVASTRRKSCRPTRSHGCAPLCSCSLSRCRRAPPNSSPSSRRRIRPPPRSTAA